MTFYDKQKLERAQERLRESATPAQRKLMDEVSAAVEAESAGLDAQFTAESKLRVWARDLCGVQLDVSEIEDLRDVCKKAKPGVFYFRAKRGTSAPLIKTAFGTVDRLDSYTITLEKALIDVTNNSQFTPLSTLGLIKLAFKRAFKRNKQNGKT